MQMLYLNETLHQCLMADSVGASVWAGVEEGIGV